MTLIYKKDDRTLTKNYRPISLSTADYKLLAFALSNRIHRVIGKLVGKQQSAYIKGRLIGCNVRLTEDVIEYANKYDLGGAIIFVDFEKAFDSLEWNFLFETLNRLGFGNMFIHWIKTLYCEPKACIKNNGWLTETFELQRGIRQGCPVSALLFILSMEILACALRSNNNIKGFNLSTRDEMPTVKCLQHADDAMLFVSRPDEVHPALNTVKDFGKVSGLSLNISKTEGIWLGKDRDRYSNDVALAGIKWPNEPVRCLGIYVGHDYDKCIDLNWTSKLEKIQRLLSQWRTRDLTLFGKITIVKILALSQIVHTASNTETPDWAVQSLNRLFYNFIWNKRDRIKRNTMIGDISQGGINMVDTESFLNALKAVWVPRIANNLHDIWTYIPQCYFNQFGRDLLFNTSFQCEDDFPSIKCLPRFYRQIICAYNKTKTIPKPEELRDCISEEYIWGNDLFKQYKQKYKRRVTLYFRSWVNCGITKIEHLSIVNGTVDETYLYNVIPDKRRLFAQILELKKVLKPFMGLLVDQEPKLEGNMNSNESIIVRKSRYFYNCIKNKRVQEPDTTWIRDIMNPETTTSDIFVKNIKDIKDKKIAEYKFKVIHRVLINRKLLSKWNSDFQSKCTNCNVDDDVFHMLLECPVVQEVWKLFSNRFAITIDKSNLILYPGSLQMNWLISHISFCIYKYWMITCKPNERKCPQKLKRCIRNDLSFKGKVYQRLKWNLLAEMFETASSAMQ